MEDQAPPRPDAKEGDDAGAAAASEEHGEGSTLAPSLSSSLRASKVAEGEEAAAGPSLTSLLKQREVQRQKEKEGIERSADRTAALAKEMEDNLRAAVGMHISAANSNNKTLVTAAQSLEADVKAIGKQASRYREQYGQLVSSLAEIGSFHEWLRDSQAFLGQSMANAAAVEALLTKEEV